MPETATRSPGALPTTIDGAKLRRRRVEAGLTQAMLAERAASSFQHISDIERGRRGALPPVTARFAQALGCTVADLLQDPTNSAASDVHN